MYVSTIGYCFTKCQLYIETSPYHTCYQAAMVALFWAQKRKLDAKYFTKVFEIKSLTCSLMPPLIKTDCVSPDVFSDFYSWFRIFNKYTIPIGLLYDSLQELGCICLLILKKMANKFFDINTEYIKCVGGLMILIIAILNWEILGNTHPSEYYQVIPNPRRQ